MLSLKDTHNYWINGVYEREESANLPENYLKHEDRSDYLASIFERFVPKTDKVLELGCNAGRNLLRLKKEGYTKLGGIEINPRAARMLEDDKVIAVHIGPIEDTILEVPMQDTIFTMAVLEHLHPESEDAFGMIAKKCKRLITIEDEETESNRHFPRNYRKVFEAEGMKQVWFDKDIVSLGKPFRARVFEK